MREGNVDDAWREMMTCGCVERRGVGDEKKKGCSEINRGGRVSTTKRREREKRNPVIITITIIPHCV